LKKSTIWVPSIACVLLSGCFSLYKVDERMNGTSIEFEGADKYFMYFYEGLPGCAKVIKLPTEYEPFRTGAKPLPLLPGREFMFSMGTAGFVGYHTVSSCVPTVSFVPEAGVTYRARFLVRTDSCAAIVRRVTRVGDQLIEVPEPTLRLIQKDSPPSAGCTVR
jgi:hypothetical protein